MRKILNIIMVFIIGVTLITPATNNADEINKDTNTTVTSEVTSLDKIAEEHKYNDVNGYYVLTEQEIDEVKETRSVNLTDHFSSVDITTYYDDGYIYGSIPYFTTSDGEIVFCAEPGVTASSIANATGESGSVFATFSPVVKTNIKWDISYGTELYNNTHNEDYLWATQILVWQDINPGNTVNSNNNSSSIKSEIDEIQSKVNTHSTLPSFISNSSSSATTYNLNWNNATNQYELTLTDTNSVWDSKFATYGNFGDYTLSNPSGANNLKVTTSNHNAVDYTLETTYNPFGHDKQKFYDAGQDLINVGADPVHGYVKFHTIPAMGNIEINKTGESLDNTLTVTVPLENTTFVVNNKDTADSYTFTTDTNGQITINNIIKGNYEYCETVATTGYILDSTCHDFVVNPGETTTINVENEVIKGSAHLHKIGDVDLESNNSNIDLGGAVFDITDLDTNTVVRTVTSDSNGYVDTGVLKYGDYNITEVSAPNGYVNSGYSEDFSITTNDQIIELNGGNDLINEAIRGGFKLTKYGEDEAENGQIQTLKGVKFEVTGITNPDFDKVYSTNRLGVIETSDDELAYGDYHIEEIETQSNYFNDHISFDFSITTDGEMIDINGGDPIINNLLKGKIVLDKTLDSPINGDTSTIPGEGIEFTIYKDSEVGVPGEYDELDVPVEIITTDVNGHAESDYLQAGTYFAKETKTLPGYTLDSTVHKVEITQATAGTNYFIYDLGTINNSINYGQIELNKVIEHPDGTISPLDDVSFAIYQDLNNNGIVDRGEDKPISTMTTDENGYAISEELKASNYLLQEIDAPENVVMNTDVIPVTVVDGGSVVTANNGDPIVNKEITNEMHIKKVDFATGEEIPGAHLQIIDELTGEVVDEWTSTTEEHIVDITYGDYIVVETIAPEGYDKLTQGVKFSVTEDGVVQTLEIENKLTPEVAITGKHNIIVLIGLCVTTVSVILLALIKKKVNNS